jgi:hypothetical protein
MTGAYALRRVCLCRELHGSAILLLEFPISGSLTTLARAQKDCKS